MPQTVTITKTCPFCGKRHDIELDAEAVARWDAGAYVQDAFPRLSAAERETLISGSCSGCFDDAFPEEEDGCNGMCLTGSDVGVPSAAIAYAHPDCPEHGS